jgi:hypothetical protein
LILHPVNYTNFALSLEGDNCRRGLRIVDERPSIRSRLHSQEEVPDGTVKAAAHNSFRHVMASASGEKGEIPMAIKSAFTKYRQSVKRGKNSPAKVDLPAPLGPATM